MPANRLSSGPRIVLKHTCGSAQQFFVVTLGRTSPRTAHPKSCKARERERENNAQAHNQGPCCAGVHFQMTQASDVTMARNRTREGGGDLLIEAGWQNARALL